MDLGVLLESPQESKSSFRMGACTCAFLQSSSSSVTLPVAWIKGSVKQKTAYEMYICDWSSDVCSSDLMSALERNPQVLAPTPHKVLGPGIDGRGIPRGPRGTRMGTGLS